MAPLPMCRAQPALTRQPEWGSRHSFLPALICWKESAHASSWECSVHTISLLHVQWLVDGWKYAIGVLKPQKLANTKNMGFPLTSSCEAFTRTPLSPSFKNWVKIKFLPDKLYCLTKESKHICILKSIRLHEKMLSIFRQKRNTNQNHNEMPLQLGGLQTIREIREILTSALRRMRRNWNLHSLPGRNLKCHSPFGKHCSSPSKC